MIEKRGRKLIDHDRAKDAMKKAQESKTMDAVKIAKAEANFYDAKKEYDSLNDKLKTEVPLYIKSRIEFMDPFMEALFIFQVG